MKETFLRKVKGDYFPKHYWSVACNYEWQHGGGARPVKTPILTGWHAVQARIGKTGCQREYAHNGKTADEWWNTLRYQTRSGGLVWIFCLDGGLTLPLLGTFQALERKQIRLWGNDGRNEVTREGETKAQWAGYAVLEDPPTIIAVRPWEGPQTYRLVDLKNYGVESWSDLKDAVDVDVSVEPNEAKGEVGAATVVCGRAVAIQKTVEKICRFLKENELGGLQTTSSSQAMYSFRRQFLRAPVFLHRNPTALELERKAYHGGRCEMFRHGHVRGPVFHYDFSSFYPSCCLGSPLPTCLIETREQVDVDELPELCWDKIGIADVTIETDEPAYPLARHGKIVFPVGRFRTQLAQPELIHALDASRIKRVHLLARYDGEPILSLYSASLYESRRKCLRTHGRATTLLLKRMLNALPGKFAQLARRWVWEPDVKSKAPYMTWQQLKDNGEPERWRSIAWNCQREEIIGESPTSCPAIAAWVTSCARIRLWKAIRIAGVENVFYTDTDSIHTNQEGSERLTVAGLVDNERMGCLRLVEIAGEAWYFRNKHYQIGNRLVCSGLQKVERHHPQDEHLAEARMRMAESVNSRLRPSGIITTSVVGTIRDYERDRIDKEGRLRPLAIWEG